MSSLINILFIFIGKNNFFELNRTKNYIIEKNYIKEEVEYLKENKVLKINIEIPKEYSKKQIEIEPSIFDGLREYKKIRADEQTDVIIEIFNKSRYTYKYKAKSFKVETVKITRDFDNYKKSGGVGFDKKDIYEIFIPIRCYNEALYSLYNDEFKEEYLKDEILDSKLKSRGYDGIKQLDNYYKDFFNLKYGKNYKKFEDVDVDLKGKIFKGETSSIFESNILIIEEAYKYFYQNIMTIILKDKNKKYSIYDIMNSNSGDTYLKDELAVINNNSKKKLKLTININNYYEAFEKYNYYGNLRFILEK